MFLFQFSKLYFFVTLQVFNDFKNYSVCSGVWFVCVYVHPIVLADVIYFRPTRIVFMRFDYDNEMSKSTAGKRGVLALPEMLCQKKPTCISKISVLHLALQV